MVHVGEKVKITDAWYVYDTYSGFLDYYRDCGSSTMVERVCSQYVYGSVPTGEEVRTLVFTVMFVREHGFEAGIKLAIINDGVNTYIINVNALSIVYTDLPFREGAKVYIKDSGAVYSSWQSLIKHVSTVIPDGAEVLLKWFHGRSPAEDEEGGKLPKNIFTVKWIGHHIARPDDDILAIISNNTRTYIMSTKGLETAGGGSWEKYIVYVRNWAVVNKETAQTARDSAGPKPYAEWLKDKS